MSFVVWCLLVFVRFTFVQDPIFGATAVDCIKIIIPWCRTSEFKGFALIAQSRILEETLGLSTHSHQRDSSDLYFLPLVVSVALCFLNSRSLQVSSKNPTRLMQQLCVNLFPLNDGILTRFLSVLVIAGACVSSTL